MNPPLWRRVAAVVGRGFTLILVILLTGWAVAALYFDLLSGSSLRTLAASGYGIAMLGILLSFRGRGKGIAICVAGFGLVLAWWLTLKPSNDRAWQADVAQTAWAEIDGDRVTIHNVRNCDYRTEGDYTPHWETRSFNLLQMRGMDIFSSTGDRPGSHILSSAFSLATMTTSPCRSRPGKKWGKCTPPSAAFSATTN